MPDRKNLPHLLKLIDDESDFVRESALRELRAFGAQLESELVKLPEGLPPEKIRLVLRQLEAPEAVAQGAAYKIGQLVKHRRYGYRGIVVAFDHSCQMEDAWYHANRTQPERNQPWYHVLVSESDQVTYPAQSSLMPDESLQEVLNPLVPYFFKDLGGGVYIRNERSWPPAELER
jgi:heat shock protein HspQ